MKSRRFALALCTALFVGTFASAVLAGPEDFGPARSFMQTKHEALKKGIKKTGEPDAATVQIFDGMLDYDHFVRESLGSSWDTLDEGQRARRHPAPLPAPWLDCRPLTPLSRRP